MNIKDQIRAEIERLISISKVENGFPIGYVWKIEAYKELLSFLDSLQQEQPEVDLEKEIEDYWEKVCDDEFGELIPRVRETTWFDNIARHFAEWGRKQVLQEIYEGKVKPVDKITAAWLDDEQNT